MSQIVRQVSSSNLHPHGVEIFCSNCHFSSVSSSKFSFQAEKLYKASMSYLLAGDAKEVCSDKVFQGEALTVLWSVSCAVIPPAGSWQY